MPTNVAELLSTSVILSMALSPFIERFAQFAGDELDRLVSSGSSDGADDDFVATLFERVDADSSGTIDVDELRVYLLAERRPWLFATFLPERTGFEPLPRTPDKRRRRRLSARGRYGHPCAGTSRGEGSRPPRRTTRFPRSTRTATASSPRPSGARD